MADNSELKDISVPDNTDYKNTPESTVLHSSSRDVDNDYKMTPGYRLSEHYTALCHDEHYTALCHDEHCDYLTTSKVDNDYANGTRLNNADVTHQPDPHSDYLITSTVDTDCAHVQKYGETAGIRLNDADLKHQPSSHSDHLTTSTVDNDYAYVNNYGETEGTGMHDADVTHQPGSQSDNLTTATIDNDYEQMTLYDVIVTTEDQLRDTSGTLHSNRPSDYLTPVKFLPNHRASSPAAGRQNTSSDHSHATDKQGHGSHREFIYKRIVIAFGVIFALIVLAVVAYVGYYFLATTTAVPTINSSTSAALIITASTTAAPTITAPITTVLTTIASTTAAPTVIITTDLETVPPTIPLSTVITTTIDQGPCNPDPCQHGAACVDIGSDLFCECDICNCYADLVNKTCGIKTGHGTDDCDILGDANVHPYPYDCGKYIQCTFVGTVHVSATIQPCVGGTKFDSDSSSCVGDSSCKDITLTAPRTGTTVVR